MPRVYSRSRKRRFAPFRSVARVARRVFRGVRRVITGRGKYSMGSSMQSAQKNAIPSMHSNNQSIVVRHREFISSIFSNAVGTVPVNGTTNLATVANRYMGTPVFGVAGTASVCAPVAGATPAVVGMTVGNSGATYGNSMSSYRINPGVGIANNMNVAQGVVQSAVLNVPFFGGVPNYTYYPCPSYGNALQAAAPVGGIPQLVSGQQQGCFPWFYKIAQQFEQYKIKGLTFEYVPVSADTASGTQITTGSIDFFIEYNSAAAPPCGVLSTAAADVLSPINNGAGYAQAQQLVLNNMWAQSTKPSEHCFIPFEASRKSSPTEVLYVAPSTVVPGQANVPTMTPAGVSQGTSDMRLYDAGTLYVIPFGQSVDQQLLGQLWVTYEIELIKPQLNVRVIE